MNVLGSVIAHFPILYLVASFESLTKVKKLKVFCHAGDIIYTMNILGSVIAQFSILYLVASSEPHLRLTFISVGE